ncbi:MAG TPA: hypothetical protein VGN57_09335 [Pirellulaceae bacterium]|nr:hypothetical protein [Pirellulaceae bacterium]
MQYGVVPYFCPHDGGVRKAKHRNDDPVRDRRGAIFYEPDPATLVDIQEVLDSLDRSPAGSKVLLADCCRDDPSAARGTRSAVGSARSSANPKTGTAAFFACSISERSYEDAAWEHGAFTKAFLDYYCSLVPLGTKVRSGSLGEALQDGVRKLLDDHPNLAGKSQTVHPIAANTVDLRLERPLITSKPSGAAPSGRISPLSPPTISRT